MSRKTTYLLIALTAAGLGFAWFYGITQPASEAESSPARAVTPVPPAPIHTPPEPAGFPVDSPPASVTRSGVVGQPYVLSDSVLDNCERSPRIVCKDFLMFVERMGAEPRNESWARDTEARIEKAVMSGERGKFRILALECRSTHCALEVASEVDYIAVTKVDPSFDALMIERPGYFAHEDDPRTGIRTLVSTQLWQTSESFDAEQAVTE